MEASIGKAIELIIEASIACCTQIEASTIRRYFWATSSREKLAELEKKLQQTYDEMQRQMDLCILDAVRQRKPHYPKYPKDTVGIEEPLQEVIKKLEWESDKKAVAVILHGFGGMGKTTLADAVFARLFEEKKEGCKFSFVKLFQDIKSTPNVVKLQKRILSDLKGEKAEGIRRDNEGREEIAVMLEKEEAFIYIDNVLLADKREQGPDALTQLLPENMGNAKKVRLLITARHKDAADWMKISEGVEKVFYAIKSLPKAKAVELLKKKLSVNKNQLNARQINGIVKICGGIPALLKVLAGFIINSGERNAVENYKTLMKEAKEKNWKGYIGGRIEQYVFAYDKLKDDLKDPFLDICSFFGGWDWKELSDIVGEQELRELEERALVTRDVKSMTARVHDVILEVGLQMTQGNRFRLTTATELEKFSQIEDQDLQKIKGIWASGKIDRLRIPAKKLDLMSGSLRVLELGPKAVQGKCKNKFKELLSFSARTSHLPFDVSLKGFTKLRHLCYYPEDLENLCQMPSSLRHIDIRLNSPRFQISSKCIQQLSNLRVLRLSDAQFEKLPEDLGDLGDGLEELIMTHCQSLQKLPESFCQLMYLEHLDLSGCSTLEELCKDFKGLSRLRVLSLDYLNKLKKLPEDFQSLPSLEVLNVRNCSKLEGKWIDRMLKMKTLQILRIKGSGLLEERWEEIQAQQCNQSWSCGVYTEQGLSNEVNLLKQFQSEFDSMLTNGEGKPLNISGRPLNTLLLVMFDGRQDFRPRSFPLPLLEESIDDIQTHFEMVYFGNHWDQLPKKVADRIVGHAPVNRDTKALFQRLFSSVVQFCTDYEQKLAISFRTSSFQMTAEIVSGENGDKYLSRWKYFEDVSEKMEGEDFVVTKCGRYLKLKELAERGGGSPIALLRELFAGGEEEISVSFRGESTKVGVDELQGKMILLHIRPGNNSFDIYLHALVEMYNVEKERFNFEIITVPIMQEDTTLDVSEVSREVPWLVLQNPWQLTNTTKYFLLEGCPRWFDSPLHRWYPRIMWIIESNGTIARCPRYLDSPGEWWYPKIMRIIESNGTFAPYNDHSVLRMLHTWGAAAFPFTKEKEEELIQKEKTQMEEEAIPHAIFLFQHLERVSEQLREATDQQKMICLCCCDEKEFTGSMRDVLADLMFNIYIIYIPYSILHNLYSISNMSSEMLFSLSLSDYEAIRFWTRIGSLKVGINATDQFQLSKMLSIMTSGRPRGNPSWMFIMNEDGNLITTKGKEIVKLISEKYSADERVKESMEQLLRCSSKKALLELEEMLQIYGEHNEGYEHNEDDVNSEAQ